VVAVRLLQFVGYEVILPRICRFQVGGAMRFGVLGPLLVEDGTGDARPVAGARQRTWLGALLVRANRTVPNGELAEIVWDGAPPAGAAALRTQVMRLRRSLGGEPAARIVTRGLGYAITLDVEELDATLFEVLYRDAGAAVRAERWREAADVTGRALGRGLTSPA
jgi:DNA-binding SARP family transcriptional activator